MVGSVGVSLGLGTMGSVVGQLVSATIDGDNIDTNDMVETEMMTGTLNCIGGVGSGIGNAFHKLPSLGTTTTALACSLTGACSIITEAVCDILGTLASILSNNGGGYGSEVSKTFSVILPE